MDDKTVEIENQRRLTFRKLRNEMHGINLPADLSMKLNSIIDAAYVRLSELQKTSENDYRLHNRQSLATEKEVVVALAKRLSTFSKKQLTQLAALNAFDLYSDRCSKIRLKDELKFVRDRTKELTLDQKKAHRADIEKGKARLERMFVIADKQKEKLDNFKQARRKGSDAIHAENRAMKADVFQWLDSQPKFKSIEAAATAITKQQPIAPVTARDWYKEWAVSRPKRNTWLINLVGCPLS